MQSTIILIYYNLNNALVHNFNIKKQVKYKRNKKIDKNIKTKKCLQKDCII